ncbi:MAG TPA: hypothetical protein VGA28_04120, partial [Desulfurivibrionaceae bacterium]
MAAGQGKKGSSGNCGERGEVFCCSLFLLLRAQKKKQEKGTPASPGPAGSPYFSPRAGRGRTNGGGKIPIGTQPSTGEAAKKGLCTV